VAFLGLIPKPEALAESMASEKPVFMDVRPWGSMSSIVTHSYIRGNRTSTKLCSEMLNGYIMIYIYVYIYQQKKTPTIFSESFWVAIVMSLGSVFA
jgi:hypothetical protein